MSTTALLDPTQKHDTCDVISATCLPATCVTKTHPYRISCINNAFGPGVMITLAEGLCGVQAGDCVRAINGKIVNNHKEFVAEVDRSRVLHMVLVQSPVRNVALHKHEAPIGMTLSGEGHVQIELLQLTGAAAAADLHVGETILAIDGHVVTGHAQAMQLIDAGTTVNLLVGPCRTYAPACTRK